VVRTFTDIEKLVKVATKLEKVLGEFKETPYEPLKEEQEEGVLETMMEKKVTTLNNTLINFFRGVCPILMHHLLPLYLGDARSAREETI
jgi:hypothetical protein